MADDTMVSLKVLRAELSRFAETELRAELEKILNDKTVRVQGTRKSMNEEKKNMLGKSSVYDDTGSVADREHTPTSPIGNATRKARQSIALPGLAKAGGSPSPNKSWLSRLQAEVKGAHADGLADSMTASQPANQFMRPTPGPRGSSHATRASTSYSPLVAYGDDTSLDARDETSSDVAPEAGQDANRLGSTTVKSAVGIQKNLSPATMVFGRKSVDVSKMTMDGMLVSHPWFEYIVCFVVTVNALVMGAESDWEVKHWTVLLPASFLIVDTVLCCFFVAELGLKIMAYGRNFFSFRHHDFTWNYFDFIIVLIQAFESIMAWMTYSKASLPGVGDSRSSLGVLFRKLRMFRVLRILRLVRVFRLVPEMHMLVVTCIASMRSLFWTLLMLLFSTFAFGTCLCQTVAEYGMSQGYQDDQTTQNSELRKYFGSLAVTVFKLYQTMFNGDDWKNLTRPLMATMGPTIGVIFCIYIGFTVVCLLNVITGVFLSSAMQTADDDKNRRMIGQIQSLFSSGDVDQSGTISLVEFEEHLEDPDMQVYLRSIDLLPAEASELFHLLDVDRSGEISQSEFVHGCMRLRGTCKAVDFAVYQASFEDYSNRIEKYMAVITGALGDLVGEDTLEYLVVRANGDSD